MLRRAGRCLTPPAAAPADRLQQPAAGFRSAAVPQAPPRHLTTTCATSSTGSRRGRAADFTCCRTPSVRDPRGARCAGRSRSWRTGGSRASAWRAATARRPGCTTMACAPCPAMKPPAEHFCRRRCPMTGQQILFAYVECAGNRSKHSTPTRAADTGMRDAATTSSRSTWTGRNCGN